MGGGGLSTSGAGGAVLKIRALLIGAMLAAWMGPAGAAEIEEARADTAREVRSPRGAMLRSLAVPGWGQFYNGRYVKGCVIAAAEVGSAVAFFVRRHYLEQEQVDGTTSRRNVFLLTTIAAILYSMGDAYVDAHLDAVDWGEVEAGVSEKGMEVRAFLKVRF